MKTPEKIIIVGAGVIGLGTGWRLVQRGCEVVIIDAKEAGGGASSAAAGMLAPTAEVRFEEEALLAMGQKSLLLYPEFVAELEHESDIDVDYRTEGTLVLGLDRDDTEHLEHLLSYQTALGLQARRLRAEEARELEPALDPSVHSAVFCPTDHQVDPKKLVLALKTAFLAHGGTLLEHTPCTSLLMENDRITGVRTHEDEPILADGVVIAAGAWSRKIEGLPKSQRPHVRPIRGQMLSAELPSPDFCKHVIRAPDAYLVPKSDGRLVIGATMEERGFEDRLTAGGVFELLRGAWEAMPGIYDMYLLEQWVGFRPMALHNHPILGPGPMPGLWYATGHGRGGILLAPLSANIMADTILS